MGKEPRNMDDWMQESLNSWASEGSLSPDQSSRLQAQVAQLAQQERRNRLTRKVYGLAAAIITWAWLLFASCPAAAASPQGITADGVGFVPLNTAGILICIGFILIRSLERNGNILGLEVNYE